MDLLIWTFFGIINGIILYVFENAKAKKNVGLGAAIMMSVAGSLCGGTLAYLLFGGTHGFSITLLLILFFEVGLITLYFSRSSRTSYRI